MGYHVKRTPLYKQPREMGRRFAGAVAGFLWGAYGTSAAVGAATGDGETLGQKVMDAIAAPPNLLQTYREVRWTLDHSDEIQQGLAYVRDHAPSLEKLVGLMDQGRSALNNIAHMAHDVQQIKEGGLNPFSIYVNVRQINDAMPDVETMRGVVKASEGLGYVVQHLDTIKTYLEPVYDLGRRVADNFSADEAPLTLAVVGTALAVGYVGNRMIGSWARRGRPGFFTQLWQDICHKIYSKWYEKGDRAKEAAGNLYPILRAGFEREVASNPEAALGSEAYGELERKILKKHGVTPGSQSGTGSGAASA